MKRRISLTLALIIWATFSFSQKQLLNKTYPRLEFPTLLQSPLKDATAQNFDNKVVVLEYWATWCSPCLANVPHINEVINHYKNDTSVVFISITDQKKDLISKFLAKRNLKGWVACDAQRGMHKAYGVSGIPHTFVINQLGVVVYDGRPEQLDTTMLNQIKKGTYVQKSEAPTVNKAKLFGAWGGGDDPIYTANFSKGNGELIPYQHTIRPTVLPKQWGGFGTRSFNSGVGISIINASLPKILANLKELQSATRVENHSNIADSTHWDIIFSRRNGYTMEKAKHELLASLEQALVFNLKDTVIEKEVLITSIDALTDKMKKEEDLEKDDPAAKSYVAVEKLLNMYEERSGVLVVLKPEASDIFIDIFGEMKKLYTMEGKDFKKWLLEQGISFSTKKQSVNMLWVY